MLSDSFFFQVYNSTQYKTDGSVKQMAGTGCSYFYQSEESFVLTPTVYSEILKVMGCSVENLSCVETRKCHSVVLTGVIFR